MAVINDPKEPNARGGNGVIWCGPGATNNPNDDYNSVDIVGHEFTHSVVQATARLIGAGESAALSESFSDIFGQLIERWDEQNASPDWIIGDDKGCMGSTCRDLWNPKAFGHPDTYKGVNWLSPPVVVDPHVNGGVQNRWFALLTDGGTGMNVELKAPYDITGLGTNRTSAIVYRTLTAYLTAASTYVDARNGSIAAARDLFGANSVSENQVIKAWCAVGLCPFSMPSQADIFDRPGGNPNPASPNNNNAAMGATPLPVFGLVLGSGTRFGWSHDARPRLKVAGLSIFPTNDIDYFRIAFPPAESQSGPCFVPAFAFNFGREVNARVLRGGAVAKTFKQVDHFAITLAETNVEDFVLEVSAPFPGQLVEYTLGITSYLRVDAGCLPNDPRIKWKDIRDCIACGRDLLSGIQHVILDPDYRQPDGVPATDHYFFWSGEGALEIPVTVREGAGLTVELVDSTGLMMTSVVRNSETNVLSVKQPRMPAGVYSLRFSGFGNGTQIDVTTPTAP
jgi:hypothetical protein